MCGGLGRNRIVRVGKKSGSVLSRFENKVHEILGNVEHPSYFPTPLPDCLCHVSFSRYSPSSIQVLLNRTNVKNGPHFGVCRSSVVNK